MFPLPINDDHSLLSMRFPQKLWKIVNECNTGAIQWSKNGKSVLLDYTKFQRDYLDSKLEIFKTTNITSFIRQLNLYGFRKVTGHYREPLASLQSPDIHEFRNDNFVRGRYDLLSKVSRKTGIMKHRTADRKRSLEDTSENEAGKSRLVLCQKALADALNNAAMHQGLHEKHKQQYNTDDSESVLSDFSGSQDSDNLCCDFGSLDWENLDWLRESSISQASTSSSNNDEGICLTSKLQTYQQNKALATSGLNECQGLSSLLDPSTSPQRSLGHSSSELPVLDCPFTLEYVMQQMDSSLTEKIYEMLMEEETKQEMILPDSPDDLLPPAKKLCQEPQQSIIVKSELTNDLEQPSCSRFVGQSEIGPSDQSNSLGDIHPNYIYKDQVLPCIKPEPQIFYEHEYNTQAPNTPRSLGWNHYPQHRGFYGNLGTGHYMY